MKRMSKVVIAVSAALAVASCSTLKQRQMPTNYPVTAQAARAAMEPGWNSPAVVRDGRSFIVITTPMSPPRKIQRREIKLSLQYGATIQDVTSVLSNLGYSVVITDPKAATRQVMIPRFQGTLGGLLHALQLAANVWFTWQDGAIIVSSTANIAVSLPQDQELADRIAAGLQPYGFKKKAIPISAEAGIVSLNLKPSQFVAVRQYLSRITNNAALVNMQVALVNVQLTQDASRGFDWSKLQVAIGGNRQALLNTLDPTTGSALSNNNNSLTNSSTGTGSTSTTTSTTSTSATTGTTSTNGVSNVSPNGSVLTTLSNGGSSSQVTLPNTGVGGLISNGALRGVLSNSAFSMIGFINFLESYGTTKTVQSVMLKTVTGQQVELKSVTQIPYVSNVGLGAYGSGLGGYSGYGGGLGGGSTDNTGSLNSTPNLSGFGNTTSTSSSGNNSNGSGTGSTSANNGIGYNGYGGIMGTAGTSEANDGITLKLLPAYDAASDTVTIELALSLQSVLSFNSLSAGNQIGTLSQPTTADQTFNDTLRMRPGQTVVVGGLTYDQIKRNNAVPLFLPDNTGNNTLSVKKEAMFIVVRPTVTILGSLQSKSAQAFYTGSN